MSFIITIFIVVPMLAPLLGQFILDAYDWKAIFYFQLFFISIMIVWFWFRQPETLTKEKRIPISKHLFTDGLKEYFRHKKTVFYTITKGFIQGSFITYLSASQQIFQEQYQMKAAFPYIFGGLAFTMGVSALSNGVLVMKYGMLKLVKRSLFVFIITSLTYVLLFMNTPNPSLAILLVFLSIQFFSIGFISGNLSSLAMQPIGHIAGVGAAISSFISMSLAVTVAILIGRFIETAVLPLFIGFCLVGLVATILISMIQKRYN
jgi:DHA1 family bicyclomycin/chloramphenicol resistance-like MFS transporter